MTETSPEPASPPDPLAGEILRQLAAPGVRSLTPADIARALAPGGEPGAEWPARLPEVRRLALVLARAGQIDILRHGRPVDPAAPVRGVIRLRLHLATGESIAQHP